MNIGLLQKSNLTAWQPRSSPITSNFTNGTVD